MRPASPMGGVLFALLASSTPAFAGTFYLAPAPQGSNGAAGGPSSPWETFAHAIGQMSAGDTLVVYAGTYEERVVIPIVGDAQHPVVVRAAVGVTPVIEGNGVLPGSDAGLVELSGAHITFEGFEVRGSTAYGVAVSGTNNDVRDCTIHGNHLYSVRYAGASGGVVEQNLIYDNVRANAGLIGLGSGCTLIQSSSNVRVQDNTVRQNFGSGISIVEGEGIVAQRNIVYDNVPFNLSAIASTDVTFRRNLSYCTDDATYHEGGARALGINLEGVETSGGAGVAPTSVVANNIIVGCEYGIFWSKPATASGMERMLIAHNTVVETINEAIYLDEATAHQDSTIANNLVLRASGPLIEAGTAGGINYLSNAWIGETPPALAQGSGDVTSDCQLSNPALLVPAGFTIASGSLCANVGTALAAVTVDYFGTNRPQGSGYDIGAHEAVVAPPDAGVVDMGAGDGSVVDGAQVRDGGTADAEIGTDSSLAIDGAIDGSLARDGGAGMDRGPAPGSDAATGGDTRGPGPGSGGCGCEVSAAPDALALVPLLVALLLAGRRTRRAAPGATPPRSRPPRGGRG